MDGEFYVEGVLKISMGCDIMVVLCDKQDVLSLNINEEDKYEICFN